MLSLSDRQLSSVQRAAALLAPHERDRFLRSLANHLRHDGGGPLSDDAISAAIQTILEGYGVVTGAQWSND
jgi:hypothetical protein